MKAIRAIQAGGPDVLQLVDVDTPKPGPGEILVRNAAVGVNFIDTYHRGGLYPIPYPSGIGLEGAGTVEAVGEGVTRFAAGDRVGYASGPMGAYAEAHVVKADRAVRIPDGLGFDTVASSLLRGMTAEYVLLRCGPVPKGSTVLIHAAAGGLGSILVQWAKALGLVVIGTVGSEAKAELARGHGCDHVLMTDTDFSGQVRALTGGEGVPVVYDGVGASVFEESLKSLKRRGLMVQIGNASGAVPPLPPTKLMQMGSLYLTRPTLGDYVFTVDELDHSAAAFFEVVQSGKVKIDIGGRWPLADARQAHEALEGRRTTGGLVLEV